MKRDPVATRYARALMDIGRERDGGQKADQIHAELMALRQDVFHGEGRVFFESPKIPRAEKKKVLRKVLEGKIGSEVMNVLQILIWVIIHQKDFELIVRYCLAGQATQTAK